MGCVTRVMTQSLMLAKLKSNLKNSITWSQKYVQADMFYIVSNSFWTTFGFVASSLSSVVLVYFFANYLDKETYGFYKYILSLSGFLRFLTLAGLDTAVTQATASGKTGILRYATKIQIKWNMIFLVASCVLSGYYLMHGNYTVGYSVIILGVTFSFSSALNTFGSFLSGKKEFKRLSLWGIFSNVAYTVAMILAIVFGKNNVMVLVSTYAFITLATTLILYAKTIRLYKLAPENKQDNKEFLIYGAHLSFVYAIANVAQYIDKIVIFHFLGAIELAVYGLATAIPERIRGYTKSLNSIVLPKLAERTMQNIDSVFLKRIFQTMAAGAVISILYALAAPYLYRIFLPQYLESVSYSQILSFCLIFAMPTAYIGSVFNSQKMVTSIYLSNSATNVIRIILFIILGSMWGIWGVIITSLIGYATGLIYGLYLWKKEVARNAYDRSKSA